MKKTLFILSLAILIPFMGISQKYVGVQSLRATEFNESEDRAGWMGWAAGFSGQGWILHYSAEVQGFFNRFEPSDLTDHVGESISRIRYYYPYNETNTIILAANPHVRVYKGGSFDGSEWNPGTLVADIEGAHPGTSAGWKTVTFPTPVDITGNEEIWFGVVFYWVEGHVAFTTDYENPDNVAQYYRANKSDVVFVEEEFFSITDNDEEEGYSWLVQAYTNPACLGPTGLTANYNTTDCSVNLSWTAPADNPNATYTIKKDNATLVTSYTTTSYKDENTDGAYSSHTWSVTANSCTLPATVNLPACVTCDAPINLFIKYSEECLTADLTWNASSGINTFNVYRDGKLVKEGVTETTYKDTPLDLSIETHTWEVVSVCNFGEGGKATKELKCTGSGISDNVFSFSIAPNPANNDIKITSSDNINRIEVINFLGQNVFTQSVSNAEVSVDVSNLNSGIYFVRVTSEKGISVQKFVKK